MASRIGGNSLARSTVEFTFPIIEKVRGGDFLRHRLCQCALLGFQHQQLASDVGIGLRLDLPIGPIRIDYGIPIQKDGNTSGGKFNFNVGYQF